MNIKELLYKITEMKEIDDESILNLSNGLVSVPDDLLNKNIFGEISDNAFTLMGHIELPYPVVNVHFLNELPEILDISKQDVENLLYENHQLVVHHTGGWEILPEKDCAEVEAKQLYPGAEAIDYLLFKKQAFQRRYIILHMLPVLPVSLRWRQNGDTYLSKDIEILYAKVLNRTTRINCLRKMGVPVAVLNREKHFLQQYIDALIDNGLHGKPDLNPRGVVYESMWEIHCQLAPRAEIPYDEILKGIHLYQQYDKSDYLLKTAMPLLQRVFESNFIDFKKHEVEIMKAAEHAVLAAALSYKDSDMISTIFSPAIRSAMENYINKKILR